MIVLLSGGATTLFVTLLNIIISRIDKRKEARAAAKALDISQSAEMMRLENESDEKVLAELWKINTERFDEIQRLNAEIRHIKEHDTLSSPTISKLYTQMRRLGREINTMDFQLSKIGIPPELAKQIEAVKREYDELEKSLP